MNPREEQPHKNAASDLPKPAVKRKSAQHPNHRGRTPFLDDVKKGQVCAILGLGCSIRTAASHVGCSDTTIYRHVRLDPKFRDDLRGAKARGEIKLLGRLETASEQGQWRATTWLLAHCHGGRYQDRTPDGLSPEQLSVLFARIVEVLVVEVHNPAERQRIRTRLDDLTASLTQDAAAAAPLESIE